MRDIVIGNPNCCCVTGRYVLFQYDICRYEVNPDKVAELEAAGLKFSGIDERAQRMEVCTYDSSPRRRYGGCLMLFVLVDS